MSQLRFAWTQPGLCRATHGWFVFFDFTDHLTGTTKRIQSRGNINRTKSTQEKEKRANAFIAAWKKRLEKGYNPFAEDEALKMPYHYTIAEAFERVHQIKFPTLRKRTKESYAYYLKNFNDWLLKTGYRNVLVSEFTKAMANEFADYLITDKGYKPRTHNDHLIFLKTYANQMVEKEWLTKSPFKAIKKKETEVGRNIAFSDEEIETLRLHLKAKDRRLYYFSQIMYYCFIRRSELARLCVRDFDLQNFTITIPAHVSKNKRQESVVIPKGLEPVLKEMQLVECNPDHYLFGRKLLTCAELYTNVNHISTRHTTKTKGLLTSKEKGLYSWKHTGACKAYYATGKDIYSLMRQLRHKDLNTTQIYLKSLGLVNNDVFRNAMVA